MPVPIPPSPPRDLHADDVLLMRLLAKDFLLLTRDQVRELLSPRSLRRTNFRLRRLVEKGYVERRYPFDVLATAPSPLYHLGRNAWEVLSPGGRDPKLAARRRRAADFGWGAMPHLISVNSVHIKFITASRAYEDYTLLRWIPQYARFWRTFSYLFRPDGYAEYEHDGIGYRYFVELDRGTERGKILSDKLYTYQRHGGLDRMAKQEDGPLPFRVLFITTGGMRRVRMILRAMSKYSCREAFWVSRGKDFFERPLFDDYWYSPNTDVLLSLDTPL